MNEWLDDDRQLEWVGTVHLNGRNVLLAGDEEGYIWLFDPETDEDMWERLTVRAREVKK